MAPDEIDVALTTRLDRIKNLTDDLARLQADSADARQIADHITRELDAAIAAAHTLETHSTAHAPVVGPRCPACASADTVRTAKRLGIATFFCGDCQHTWERRDPTPRPTNPKV